jgi:hypothetical protein
MKERSKERMAELLMEELLAQLGERESLRRKLGDMTGLPIDDLIERLLDDFERIVEYHRVESQEQLKQRKERQSKRKQEVQAPLSSSEQEASPPQMQSDETPDAPLPSPEVTEQPRAATEHEEESDLEPAPPRSLQAEVQPEETAPLTHSEPVATEIEEPPSSPPAPSQAQDQTEEVEVFLFERGFEELAMKVEKEYSEKLETEQRQERVTIVDEESTERSEVAEENIDSLMKGEEVERGEVEAAESVDEELFQISKPPRTPYRLEDEDYLYVHGVGMVPEADSASPEPFMMEEKGIDARGFAFAIDYSGLRFYLSKVNLDQMNVSKTGVLLLGKQESIHTQGVHENVLNELRVSVYVLDARLARVLGTVSSRSQFDRVTTRPSHSPPVHQRRYDIKELEKILSKEKKIAEYIHGELGKVAVRSDIDMIVGFGSGSSEDWKQILKASYEVQKDTLQKFYLAVTDLQYHHILFDLMLSLSGDREFYSFKEK